MTFELGRLRHCRDVSPADWIGPRLTDWFTLTSVVPAGFAAYARILHRPMPDEPGQPDVTWAEVAESTGRVAHALMQWHVISTGNDGRPDWAGGVPNEGEIDAAQLDLLCQVLAAHTTTPGDCHHALWNGFGGWSSGAVVMQSWPKGELPAVYRDDPASVRPDPIPPVLPDEVINGPLVRLPHREYFLFAGPVDAAADFEAESAYGHRERKTPQLLWPADLAWCVATEIDFDSTLVGGSAALVDAIVAHPGVEAYPVPPDADITHRGDVVNDPDASIAPN